jgi:hypothetical protein
VITGEFIKPISVGDDGSVFERQQHAFLREHVISITVR